jgi:hypothetical protein
LLGDLLGEWVRQDEESALEALEMVRGRDDYEQVITPMLERLASTAPERLLALVEIDPALSLDGLASQVANGWSRHAPSEAAEWAMRLPDDQNGKEDAIRSVANVWLRQDTVAASEWIARLPEGRARDGAVRQLVQQVRRSDPEAALEWALSISDEGKAEREAQQVLGS